MKRYWFPVIVVSGALALVAGVGSYVHHLRQLRGEIENTFLSRHELVSKFVALHRDQVTVMHNLLTARYAASDQPRTGALQLREHPALKVWELVDPKGQMVGALTGDSTLPLSSAQWREVHAAIGMDAQTRAALQFDHDAAWLYYISASGFIYIAPSAPIDQFHFSRDLYQRGYWAEAGPKLNPERRMILHGPYKDLAGQGWVLTFALPVYDGEHFLGIVALDLRIDTLQQLTRVGASLGEAMMVSEHDHLIASQNDFQPGSHLHPPLSDKLIDWREDQSSDLWLSSQIVKDELWLVHRVHQRELYLAAARESVGTWIMILLAALLVFFAGRLKDALAQVTRMTVTDPLTQVLNRRGLYEQASGLMALAGRKHLPLALMIMDIDHFKKVNDTHGHAAGDSVLQQLGAHASKARRPFDIVSRWGGEEFVFLFLLDETGQALTVAERMRQEAQRTRIQPGDLPITISGGLVVMQDGESVDAAVKRADELLYQAKSQGRNQIVSKI